MHLDAFFCGEVKPALGCTEPGAVALATSTGAKHLRGRPDKISLRLSPNIYKNGVNVGVPNTGGLTGNSLAAALGVIAGDSTKGLQSLVDVKPEDVEEAKRLVAAGTVAIEVVSGVPDVYIEATLTRDSCVVTVIISGRHDNIVEIRVDGAVLMKKAQSQTTTGQESYVEELLSQDMEGLWRIVGELNSDQEAFMIAGAEMNMAAAEQGIKASWGCGVGYHLGRLSPEDDLLWRVKAMAGPPQTSGWAVDRTPS